VKGKGRIEGAFSGKRYFEKRQGVGGRWKKGKKR